MAGKTAQEKKEEAWKLLDLRPQDFKWKIGGEVLDKTRLVNEIESESDLGKLIIELAQGIAPELPNKNSYALGKRAVCLICGTELLTVKAPDKNLISDQSVLVCCGQITEIKRVADIPSSD